ncbi:MAG: hypothetical protein J6S14_11045 [Clostridia bacterium]|nr:hypothetical protein [Clostridia bacterium]
MKKHVNVLGVKYEIVRKPIDEMENGFGGFCDPDLKRIEILKLDTIDEWKGEPKEKIAEREKLFLRHEIVHAFFNESGIRDNGAHFDLSWTKNEEMVDWIAIQGEKIYKAWSEAGAL